jgi:hypothetical protein
MNTYLLPTQIQEEAWERQRDDESIIRYEKWHNKKVGDYFA